MNGGKLLKITAAAVLVLVTSLWAGKVSDVLSIWLYMTGLAPVSVFDPRTRDEHILPAFRGMLGPLAAIPPAESVLEEGKLEEITNNLKKSFSFIKKDEGSIITESSTLYPVLFVPGLMGTQIETKLTERQKAHWWLPNWFCEKTTNAYEQIWIPRQILRHLIPFAMDCYVETMMFRWNYDTEDGSGDVQDTTDHEKPPPHINPWRKGIDSRASSSFDSVMELGPNTPTFQYYATWLTQQFGYQPDQQMIAQPYDWRVGPETWMLPGREFDQMKTAIEKVVNQNQGRGVVALSVSAGGPFFALFLNQHVDTAWKKQNIHAFVSVSGAFSGSAIAPLQLISSQHNTFIPDAAPVYIRDGFTRILRATSSISWLFPHEDSYHDTLISTPSKQYRAHELGEALIDAGYSDQAKLYESNRPYFGGTNLVPGVPTYCLSGYGIPTFNRLSYSTDDMSDLPWLDMDDGDNCLTVESVRQCDTWASQQEAPIHVQHYFNQSHAGLLYSPDVVDLFFSVVAGADAKEARA